MKIDTPRIKRKAVVLIEAFDRETAKTNVPTSLEIPLVHITFYHVQ